MRRPPVQSDRSSANSKDPQMLVLGYHGTLQTDPAFLAAVGAATQGWPPQMEMLLEPFVANARLQLARRIPAGHTLVSGEPIPVRALIEILRQRLQEILTLPLADQLPPANASATLTEMDLTREFPALVPLLRKTVSEWVTATVTFLERLQRDQPRLAEWLDLGRLPPVESVSGTTSDTHPGGHAVLRVCFQGGICIYYKPRPVTGEWLWHKLLASIAEVEPTLRLPAARVLPGSSPARYGWMESLLPQGTAHRANRPLYHASSYWHAAGAVLCLAYHAGLTDLHLGNIIATPIGPAVTDAECLATPTVHDASMRGNDSNHTTVGQLLQSFIATGLLPIQAKFDLPDVSGLFGSAVPVPFLRLPHWSIDPHGSYHFGTAPAVLLDHGNMPAATSPLAVLPQLLAGYRHAAGALLQARKTLLVPYSPWRALLERSHAPRIVVRDTLTYALLLSQSLAPEHLRSQSLRRRALHRALQQQAVAGLPNSLLRAELQALLQLHIPRLSMLPGTRTLAGNSARPMAHRFSGTTPAQQIIRRMESLSAETLEAIHIPALLLGILQTRTSSNSQ